MTKPFSLQSPEVIAKEYAGNKQKIGQAAQMGLLDPTAALLAGMFIDRVRSAATQEQVPQQTIAQQVFAPRPAMPPQAGLGSIAPQGAPQMPPAQPPAPPPQGPVGMAEGGAVGSGLDVLDLPDSMFSEPTNGDYAGGGIVAFAKGDEVILDEDNPWLQPVFSDKGIFASAGRALDRADRETAARNRANRGQIYKVGDRYVNERGFPVTMRAGDQYLVGETTPALIGPSIRAKNGAQAQAYGASAHAAAPRAVPAAGLAAITLKDPSKFVSPDRSFTVDKPAAAAPAHTRPGVGASKPPAAPKVAAVPDKEGDDLRKMADGMKGSFEDRLATLRKMTGMDDPTPAKDALRKSLDKIDSPEAEKKFKHERLWTTLAQIGSSMASSKSPSFLQAAGEAMKEGLPQLVAMNKDRKTELQQALKDRATLEGMDRQEKREFVKMAMDWDNQSQQLLLKAQELIEQRDYHRAALALQEAEQAQQYALGMAGIRAQSAAASRVPVEERLLNLYMSGPSGKAQVEGFLGARYGQSGKSKLDFTQRGGKVVDYGSLE